MSDPIFLELDELRKWLRESQNQFMEADMERNRLRTENEKLRAALKPFADMLDHYEKYDDRSEDWLIPLSVIRAAAAALKETGDE